MMTTQLIKRLFTVKEYHHMIEAGILTKDDKVELIRGEIVQMAAVGRRHTSHVKRLTELFYIRLLSRVTIGVQDPVELDDHSEPEPDISLLRRRDDFYESGHPQSEDILLIVEVADA
ncbi:Uma2 family endonuclease, partial [Microcoleus sp. K4-C2]|uniref:Uma2 family endonuclease n=1 Tax=Microcoleus sp. K4-C2 TaxID=2818792 RepID=UPI002FD02263